MGNVSETICGFIFKAPSSLSSCWIFPKLNIDIPIEMKPRIWRLSRSLVSFMKNWTSLMALLPIKSCGAMIASKACSTVAFDAFSRRMIVLTKLVNACSKDETLICALSWKEGLKQLSERDDNSRIENVNFYIVILVALK